MNTQTNRKFDLEDRLVDFGVSIVDITESIVNSRAGNHLAGQIVRSGTSPALHYGEAQSAESRNDFIHKLKVLLKELRETNAALKLIKKAKLSPKIDLLDKAAKECNELISIFMKSVETARRNNQKSKKDKEKGDA
ncbi:MAG: four helix bundle protein [Chitinophagaceae bacterium]|nr:four helix bundle protein [Chitinophagaceae bacterium]MBX9785154.1 four helix bundle protein [Chitinophagaceae bacterium]